MVSDKERDALLYISGNGLDITERPFLKMAADLGMAEEDLITTLRDLRERDVVTALRGVLDHRKAGYVRNAMIAWSVPAGEVDAIKDLFLAEDRISHCYERGTNEGFDFNLFTMMHARGDGEIEEFAEEVSKEFGVGCEILYTERELKKTKLNLRKIIGPRAADHKEGRVGCAL